MKSTQQKDLPDQPIYEDLTYADVKACKDFETISDELAQKIAEAIRVYTEIIYTCFVEGRLAEDNATVSLPKQQYKQAA